MAYEPVGRRQTSAPGRRRTPATRRGRVSMQNRGGTTRRTPNTSSRFSGNMVGRAAVQRRTNPNPVRSRNVSGVIPGIRPENSKMIRRGGKDYLCQHATFDRTCQQTNVDRSFIGTEAKTASAGGFRSTRRAPRRRR